MEKAEWEEELSSKMDKVLFYSTLIPSLCIYYRFNVALLLSIKCAKSPWKNLEPKMSLNFDFATVTRKSIYIRG